MAYTTIDDPTLYFETLTWTGDGNTPRTLTGLDFQADMIWSKRRDDAAGHNLLDSVRGAGANSELCPSSNGAEGSNAAETFGYLSAFTSDGFTVTAGSSDNAYWNNNTATYVAWCWKESATAGFDIVSYTGNGSNRTISHSLSAKPAMMIVKQRSEARDWWVYNKNLHGTDGATGVLYLDLTDAAGTSATTSWNSTAPTTSVFSLGTTVGVNKASQTYIAYLFAEKQGFSKFGSYIGNGNVDGTYVHLGFRPAWLLIKRSSASGTDWILHDNKRAGFNVNDDYLAANTSAAEVTGNTYQNLDLLANGFKKRRSGTGTNTSGETYVYMAFAEQPFVNSKGVPCNAR